MAKAKFRYNTRELSAAIQRELQLCPERAKRAMDAVGGYLAGEAKERSPVDEGFLTADISNKTIENKGSFSAAIFIPSNATSADYAIPMHEGQYTPGEKSQKKAQKTGKVVGRKFITRAIDENLSDAQKIIQHELRK